MYFVVDFGDLSKDAISPQVNGHSMTVVQRRLKMDRRRRRRIFGSEKWTEDEDEDEDSSEF